ncbi:MAG: hypothetical protein AAGM22_12705 [Acidobacteriota bacterium]
MPPYQQLLLDSAGLPAAPFRAPVKRRRLIRRPLAHFAFSLVLASLLAPPSGAQFIDSLENSPETRIRWSDDARTEALFIPQKILDQSRPGALPLADGDLAVLQSAVKTRQRGGLGAGDSCTRFTHDRRPKVYPRADAVPLKDFLSRFGQVFTGRVTAIVPGWSPQRLRPASLVYMEIEGILQSPSGLSLSTSSVAVGDTIAFHLDDASISVQGTVLCTELHEEIYRPKVNDEILLHAAERGEEPDLFDGLPFLIFDGRVWPGQLAGVEERSSIAFEKLAAELGGR